MFIFGFFVVLLQSKYLYMRKEKPIKKNVKKKINFGQINNWCLFFLFKFANYTG